MTGWVGRYGWLAFVICNPPVLTLPWLLKIMARNISYPRGMCICCLAGRQMNTNPASSIYNTIALWPKTELEVCLSVFRIKSKLPSMPYGLQKRLCFSLLSHSHPLPFPCLSYTHTPWHSIHRGLLAVLPGTLCSSVSLLSSHALHCAGRTLPGFSNPECDMAHRNSYCGAPGWHTYSFLGFILLLHFHATLELFPCQFLIGLYPLQRGGWQVAYLYPPTLSVGTPWNFMLVLHTSALSHCILQQLWSQAC